MRDFIKSTLRFSWAMSLFGVQQLENMIEDSGRQGDKTTAAFDSVTRETKEHLGDAVRDAFESGDRLQGGVVDAMFDALLIGQRQPQPPASATTPDGGQPGQQPPANPVNTTEAYPVYSGRLNTSAFVVLGEGLAAGMGDFSLSDETQADSFAAQMARQMGAQFSQPLIQPPGICNAVGFAELPVIVPVPMQTTVLDQLPPAPADNLSVPGFRLSDALNLRPSQPLVRRKDAKQTAANLILGMTPIAYGEDGRLPTQLECAVNRRPTFTVVELGYHEALEAAVKADPGQLPDADSFRSDYTKLLKSLKDSGSEVLVLTIPDPLDTAHFSPVNLAAKILKVDPAALLHEYELDADDLVTAGGLIEIGFQLFSREIGPLPDGCVLSAEVATEVSRRVGELNAALTSLARQEGALVYDLHAFFRRAGNEGLAVGSRRLTAEYLGGFYSLNGYYPGATGHALIANELLHQLNITYGADFRQIDVQTVMQNDSVAAYRQAEGPDWPAGQLPQPRRPTPEAGGLTRRTDAGAAPVRSGRGVSSWEPLGQPRGVPPGGLQLPPGLEQVLPLSKAASYFGDAIRAVNCRDANESRYGSCRGLLFGGFTMVNSHLSGSVRLRFTPPVNGVTHFEVTHDGGLTGDDGTLSAPQFYKLPALQNSVQGIPGLTSSGDLNLNTGEVTNLTYYTRFSNTALLALSRVNPNLPAQPIVFSTQTTPTQYGSAWARFEQRDDGLLDFSFYGSAFLPLGSDFQGDPVRFPLPICGPTLQFASVPAKGTALHPHLCLSTKEPEVSAQDACPEIPFNTVQELTLFTHNSSFGDAFTLNAPAVLGGNSTGRSHVLGRAMIQFGEPCGGYSVPVAVSLLNAGGELAKMDPTPISQAFPGRLYPGPRGFDEFLRFPLRTFSLDDLEIIDDPFDISVGAVDLRTGKFVTELLHRSFISQDLFFALIRIEPRTPQSSFFFRGPAVLEEGADGLVFRFEGQVHIPYPEGFLFPKPNFATGFVVGPDSALDPFLWVHAIQDGDAPRAFKQGRARDVLASNGQRFSYSYEIPSDPARHKASFEYENQTQQGQFRMHSLAWVGFGNSVGSGHESGEYDTLTFAGFGVWSKDGSHTLQQATVQISTSPKRPYVGIQIDAGNVSNVNTKPPNIKDALP